MSLTEVEKKIYNSFLIAQRTIKGLPFKLRQNFDKISDAEYTTLKKLSFLFASNKQVDMLAFFTAPYKMYQDETYFDLQFFKTPKAIACYTAYMRKKETLSPDTEDMINACKRSCTFILRYCRTTNITLSQYKVINLGNTPVVLQHLRDHKINFYILHGLECNKTLKLVEPDLLDFFIKDFHDTLNITRTILAQSQKLKHIISAALKIIEVQLLQSQATSV